MVQALPGLCIHKYINKQHRKSRRENILIGPNLQSFFHRIFEDLK